ncbi:DUF4132 domain-containing protein [Nocardia sp. NPDC056000]|uniref:DUF4132 domain-containing protein n=1 Tax=Nocardia sp. NPDC056000 TaxID=3345674 RepID=UPI0035DB089F
MARAISVDSGEDVWQVPAEWPVVPGRECGAQVAPDPELMAGWAAHCSEAAAEVAAWVAVRGAEMRALLEAVESAELRESGLAALQFPSSATPLGAAVVAQISALVPRWSDGNAAVADAWVGTYGVAFAAEAAVRLSSLDWALSPGPSTFVLAVRRPDDISGWMYTAVLFRMRQHLAMVPEDIYRAAVARLAALRDANAHPVTRIATSVLAPTEQLWVDADIRDAGRPARNINNVHRMLLMSITTDEQFAALVDKTGAPSPGGGIDRVPLYTGIARLGADAAAMVDQLSRISMSGWERRFIDILAYLPSDEAFSLLLSHVNPPKVSAPVLAAMARFPRRAMRVLARCEQPSPVVRDLRERYVRTRPDLAAEFGVVVAARAWADLESLPESLRTPLHQRRVTRTRPAMDTSAFAHRPVSLDWRPGEQARWATHPDQRRSVSRVESANAAQFVSAAGPVGDIDPEILMPFTGTQVTTWMVGWLNGKKHRGTARRWFDRHIATAAPDLIAMMLAGPGTSRTAADKAVRALADRHRDTLLATAERVVPGAVDIVTAVVDSWTGPKQIPALPEWLMPAGLPPIILRENGFAVPDAAVCTVATMLSLNDSHGRHPGLAHLAAIAEPESLARFAWGLFEAWMFSGMAEGGIWVMQALALFGDDEIAWRLEPIVRTWYYNAGSPAEAALRVLVAIDSDASLAVLHRLSQQGKAKAFKKHAGAAVRTIADARGLTNDEFADRLVPDLGLRENGAIIVEYGPRAFVVRIDQRLNPLVFDAVPDERGGWVAAESRKSVPRPAATDDQDRAALAYQDHTAFKEILKTTAAEQITRLEQAMLSGRRWTAAEHQRLFVGHPVLQHLVRRLVWVSVDDTGAVTGSFRIAEDGSRADIDDELVDVADHTLVGVAHPVQLGQSTREWAQVFADYEILSPFAQLDRPWWTAQTPGFADALDRLAGRSVRTGTVLGLKRFGWRWQDTGGGLVTRLRRTLADSVHAELSIEPGLWMSALHEQEKQTITAVTLSGASLADLDPIVASEMLRELHLMS